MTPMRQKYHLPDWTKRAVARRGPGGLVCLQRRGRVSHGLARERWPAQREDLERELQGRPADLPVPRVRVDDSPYDDPYTAGTLASYKEWYGKWTIIAPVR